MKKCLECEEEIVGRRSNARYCNDYCATMFRSRRWRQANKGRIKTKNTADNSDVPKRIIVRIKSKCKGKGIEFDLTESDIVVPEYCPVLGIKLVPHQGKKGYHPDSPSLDRIHPDRGYVKDNVRVVSARANLLKNDASIDELEKVLDDLRSLYEEETAHSNI